MPEAVFVKLQPLPGKPSPDWSTVLVAGSQQTPAPQLLSEIQVPPPVGSELKKLITPGTLLVTTPRALLPENRSATDFFGVQASDASAAASP